MLHALVEQGNTVVVIEHNLDVIKTADWVIDLGPEGGVKGGEIVAEGTPEEVVKEKRSFTGQYLAPLLKRGAGRRWRRSEPRNLSELILEGCTGASRRTLSTIS